LRDLSYQVEIHQFEKRKFKKIPEQICFFLINTNYSSQQAVPKNHNQLFLQLLGLILQKKMQ